VASTCEFAARDAFIDREYFDLAPMATYLFACVSDEEGNFSAPIRKVVPELSSGLQLSTNRGHDNLEIAADAFLASQRGQGVRWRLAEDDESFAVTAAGTPFSQPLDVLIANDLFAWSEGELMSIEGRRLGLGYQWYTPNVDERGGNLYSSQAFEATGTLQGRDVRGYFSLDTFYGPTGQVYNTGPIFNAMEIAWVSFVNVFEDGSHQSGGLCLGKGNWGFGVVSDQNGPIVETTAVDADVTLDVDRYVQRARFVAGGTEWDFSAIERGQMRSLAMARNDAYHGQAGRVRLVGDERVPTSSHAWIETFPLNGLDPAA